MGRVFLLYVETENPHCCGSCGAHLAAHDSIISKAFQGRHGRAFLFENVINTNSGPTENRLLLTGLHVVADIYCNACETRLGWKYVEAFEESQKYKEGKFILEKACGDPNPLVARHRLLPPRAPVQAMIMKEEELRRREDEELMRRSALEADSSRRSSLEAGDDDGSDELLESSDPDEAEDMPDDVAMATADA